MLFNPKNEDRLDRLAYQLRAAPALTPELISNVIADACTHLPVLNRAAVRIDRLIGAGAWSACFDRSRIANMEARRLVYEDGEWHCSLSKQPNLPMELDETADASHEVLALAILSAFLEARRRTSAARETGLPTVPHVRAMSDYAVVCCDNFA